MIARIFSLFTILFFPLFLSTVAYAADYKTDYQVEYFLDSKGTNLNALVKFNIVITHLQSDTYVKKFGLTFPKAFDLKNISATTTQGAISTSTEETDDSTKILLEFTDPKIGKDTQNIINLQFNQDNLFKINGNVWEVILPIIESRDEISYKVTVNLPASGKKISIAKPVPDLIQENRIVWNNPKTRTIYAVFGDTQYYSLQLNYNLRNDRITPVYTDVALPPDTSFQKTYLNSISPKPSLTYTDEDGNFLARYYLKPKENKLIVYKGVVKLFAKPREDNRKIISESYEKQKNFLLTAKPAWKITTLDKIEGLKSPQEVHNFVATHLQYNYEKLSQATRRHGAEYALKNPDQSVCTEFADLFVAVAREKGIPARELEGYGFSNDSRLRPLSLNSDVLHAWAEYYDVKRNLWNPVDPTWENTSGIDYFSSFDLNHIVFAIHSKDPDYPLPAGMYKTEETKDISVNPILVVPSEDLRLNIEPVRMPKSLNDVQPFILKVVLRNDGNVYRWDIPVEIKSRNITSSPSKTFITLAPYESKKLEFELKTGSKGLRTKGNLEVLIAGKKYHTAEVTIQPFYYDLSLRLVYILFGIGVAYFSIRLLLLRRRS